MKKLILSYTLICFSLFGKKGIVDAYNNIPTKPQTNNLLHNVPVSTNAIPAVPSIVEQLTPVANVVNTVTTVVSEPINQIPALPTDVLTTIIPASGLFNLSTVEEVIPKINLLNLIPLGNVTNTLPVVNDITSVPNILAESPVLEVTNALPVNPSVIENVITEILNKKTEGAVVCYKIITKADNQTRYVFAPSTMYKNPLKNIYESITELVTLLAGKLQELFGNTNNIPETNTNSLTDSLATYSENKE